MSKMSQQPVSLVFLKIKKLEMKKVKFYKNLILTILPAKAAGTTEKRKNFVNLKIY